MIHAWIMEAHDWFEDKAIEMEKLKTQGHTSDPIKFPERKGSSVIIAKQQLQNVAAVHQRAQDLKRQQQEAKENEALAKDLDNMNEDEDLLNGLDKLAQKEKEEVRALTGNSEQGQG